MSDQPINRLDQALTEFRSVYPDASLITMQVFLKIALKQGIGSRELIRNLGTSQSTISRHQMILSSWSRDHIPGGLGIIETVEDPRDRRSKICFLTERGRALAAILSRILDPGSRLSAADFVVEHEMEGTPM